MNPADKEFETVIAWRLNELLECLNIPLEIVSLKIERESTISDPDRLPIGIKIKSTVDITVN